MSEATIQARLRKCISDLRHMMIEHHSYDVMKSEHCLCPVCSQQKNEDVLNESYSLEKAGDCVPANYQTPDESTLASATGSADGESVAMLRIPISIRNLQLTSEALRKQYGEGLHMKEEPKGWLTIFRKTNPPNAKSSEVAGRKE